jgi:WD40 repeat protein
VFADDRDGERGHVAAVSRIIDGLPEDGTAGPFVDDEDEPGPGGAAATRLDVLRQRLRERLGPQLVDVTTVWTDGAPSPRHLGTLPPSLDDCLPLLDPVGTPTTVCEAVWSTLGRVIHAECLELSARSPSDVEHDEHVRFRDDRAGLVVGRDQELATIAEYLSSRDARPPLAVVGRRGCGKSALLARASLDAAERERGPQVVVRFVGATASSTSGVRLLRGLGAELGARDAPADLQTLTEWFPAALGRAGEQGDVVVFLDALDQLAAGDGARTLAWLPYVLPPRVRVVVSAAPGDVGDVLAGRQRDAATTLSVGPLSKASGARLLDTWLRSVDRRLVSPQRAEVLTSFHRSGSPLHLRLAFEEGRLWRSSDPPTDLADDVPGLVRQLFGRLSSEANHGAVLVERSLGYLAAARHGLTEDEMLDVLSADPVVMGEAGRRSAGAPPTGRLPPIIWSRLYDELDPYLIWRDADGTATLGFFHRQFADVVETDLVGPDARRELHGRLADYFDGRPPDDGPPGTGDLRRLAELPWHLARCSHWDRFAEVVCDFAFLDARVRTASAQAVIDDLDLALDDEGARDALPPESVTAMSTLRATLRLGVHVLARDHTELGPQLLGRIDPGDNRLLGAVLDGARAAVAGVTLRPEDHSLAPPGGDLVATLAGHASTVRAIAITPDGQHGVSGSADGTLRVWDLDRQTERFVIPVGHGEVWSVAVTPDGQMAVSGSDDGSIDQWDITSGAHVRGWIGEGRCRCLVMTPDGRQVLSGTDGPAALWDVATGDRLGRIHPSDTATTNIALSGDARLMIIGGVYDYVYLWDLPTDRSLARWPQANDSWVSAVAMTSDGRWAYSADGEGRIKVWDVERRLNLGQFDGHGYEKVSSIAVTPDGSRLVTADVRGRIVVHRGVDAATAREFIDDVVLKVVGTSGHGVQQLALTPDGRRAITSGSDGTVRVWDVGVEDDEAAPSIFAGGYSLDDTDFQTWWRRVLVTRAHGPAAPALDVYRRFDAQPTGWSVKAQARARWPGWDEEGDPLEARAFTVVDRAGTARSPVIEPGRCVTPSAVSRDGRRVAFLDKKARLSVWDVTTGVEQWSTVLEDLPAEPSPDAVLDLSADGQTLLCAMHSRIRLWDLSSGRPLIPPQGHFEWDKVVIGLPRETAPRFTPDGRHVLAVRTPKVVGLWRAGEADSLAERRVPKTSKELGLGMGGGCAWWWGGDDRLRHWSIGPTSTAAGSAPSFGRSRSIPVEVASVRVSAEGDIAVGVDGEQLKLWQLPHRRPIVELPAEDVRSVGLLLTSTTESSGWQGLLARGGTRLELFDLPSLERVAGFEADAAFDACSLVTATELACSTVDGRRHRLRMVGGRVRPEVTSG